jgi:DNA-binding CsgD family transcriptional regulator
MALSARHITQRPIAQVNAAGGTGHSPQDPIRVVLLGDNRLACDQLAALLDGQPHFKVVATAAAVANLTQREWEIADLIGAGLPNKEIAQRLDIATHTVKSHVHNILEKLALHSRLQIAVETRWARELTQGALRVMVHTDK